MTSRLIVLADAKVMGELRQAGDRVDFEYDAAWQRSPAAYPLSLSMPLARRRHPSAVVKPFLSNLLPDSEQILSGWARRFHSSRNPFALLAYVGEDCAGAIQIVPPERRDLLLSRVGSLEWLSEADVARRLRDLRRDAALGRTLSDSGQFSLAGAQAKTALCYQDGRWGVPSGAIPTTHILKPSTLEFDSYEANEHFCLELAGQLGLPRVRSDVRRFEDQVAIVVERYDRLAFGGQLLRLHQEDFCQALGVTPSSKYENEGGPSAVALAATTASGSSAPLEDLRTLSAAFIFNWLIVGTDAHAKNYSLLLGGHGQVRLAPLYDLSSALPYAQIPFQKAKLAMKIGGKYRVRDIGKHEWQKHAVALKVDAEELMGQLRGMLKALPDAASAVLAQCRSAGVDVDLPERLRTALTERATRLQIEFGFAT